MFTIYQITNTINQKSYIGFTSASLEKRWKQHRHLASKGSPWALSQSIRKYGSEAFYIESLEEGWDPEIGKNIREPYWISVLKPEYNMTQGGEGVLGLRRTKRTEESKRRSSLSVIGNKNAVGAKHSQKSILKRAELLKGRKHTEEQNKMISERLKGNQNALGCKHSNLRGIQFSGNMTK